MRYEIFNYLCMFWQDVSWQYDGMTISVWDLIRGTGYIFRRLKPWARLYHSNLWGWEQIGDWVQVCVQWLHPVKPMQWKPYTVHKRSQMSFCDQELIGVWGEWCNSTIPNPWWRKTSSKNKGPRRLSVQVSLLSTVSWSVFQ